MNFFAKYTGKFLDFFCSFAPYYLVGVLLLAVADRLVFYALNKIYFQTTKTKAQMDAVLEKEKPNSMEDLIRLLGLYNYPLLGGPLNLLSEAVLSIGLVGIFQDPARWLSLEEFGFEQIVFHLTDRPIQLLQSGAVDANVVVAFVLVALAAAAFIAVDLIMDKASVFSTEYNKLIWLVFVVTALFFPLGYTWYWLCIRIADLFLIYTAKPTTLKPIGTKKR